MNEKTPDKKVSHFSTRLVERTGTLLVEKNVVTRSKSGRFIERMTLIDKTNLEIEQAFRLASEKVSRA